MLAEYLFEKGLSETFTPSALLRDLVEHLLIEYHDGLAIYGGSRFLNDTDSEGTTSIYELIEGWFRTVRPKLQAQIK